MGSGVERDETRSTVGGRPGGSIYVYIYIYIYIYKSMVLSNSQHMVLWVLTFRG